MSKPHPKGPRAFRSFFEANRHPARSKLAIGPESLEGRNPLTVELVSSVDTASLVEDSPYTVTESTEMIPAITINLIAGRPRPQGLDLTAFAGRVAPPDGVLGAGFDLPATFFSRLSANHPVDPASAHLNILAAKS